MQRRDRERVRACTSRSIDTKGQINAIKMRMRHREKFLNEERVTRAPVRLNVIKNVFCVCGVHLLS